MNFENQSIRDFCAALSSSAPTPGGGTASAAAGVVGASLVAMVCALTLTKEKYKDSHDALRPVAEEAAHAQDQFRLLMDEDSRAFDGMAQARRMPRESEEQTNRRAAAVEEACRRAAEVPMQTARLSAALLARTPLLAEKGNPNAASDAGVAALLLAAAAEGALLNVSINLPGVGDAAFVAEMERETASISQEVERLRARTVALVRGAFKA